MTVTRSPIAVRAAAAIPAQRTASLAQRVCYLPHCGAPAELRVVVSGMDWYRCTGCGIEYPEVAYAQRPVAGR
ncbi:hypothetical protein [Pseudokineococcus sp. 1T1Z-3]|uniref:hypothetical protein n=1 Tax=Pseudokineococcus sp. 1T1Z-3 TaxID=3132745 RepID=UPI00309531AE